MFAWAREEANRLANADAGNLRRQAAAAARHTRRDRAGGRARRAAARAARRGRAAPAAARRHARRAGRGGHAAADASRPWPRACGASCSGRTCDGRLGRIEQGPRRIDCAAAWTDEGTACPFASGSTASAASAATSSAPRRSPAPTSTSWRSTTSRTPPRSRTCSSTTPCSAATRASSRPPSDGMIVDGEALKVVSHRDPAELPWADLGADVVLESTGFFADRARRGAHHGGRQEGRDLRARQGSRRDARARRQRGHLRPRRAPADLDGVVHHQLPRARRARAARRVRHRAGLHDDDARLHGRPAPARHRRTPTCAARARRRSRSSRPRPARRARSAS